MNVQTAVRADRQALLRAAREEAYSTPLKDFHPGAPRLFQNDTLSPPRVPVPMTTVHLDYKARGREAGRMLVQMMDDRLAPPPQRIIATQLIVRESTAPPSQELE